jgi:SNF2 family DNA or RNA helicase
MRARSDLRPAQVSLVEEMKRSYELGAVLGMGGGKTVSTLTAFLDLHAEGTVDTLLVLAPPRVISVWPREVEKWQHLQTLDVVSVVGSPTARQNLLKRDARVYVLSHDLIPWLVDNWTTFRQTAGRVVLAIDEISRFRNPSSKRAKKLLTVIKQFDAIWGLTGTPQPDGYEDLYMTLKVLSGGRVWGDENFDTWRKMRFYPMDRHGYSWKIHSFMVEQLDAAADVFLMKVPDDHTSGIPALNEGPDFDIWIDPSPRQLEAHAEMLKKLIVQITEEAELAGRELTDEDYVIALSRGVASGKLEQIAQGFLYDDERNTVDWMRVGGPSPKHSALRDALEEALEPSLLVYRFRHDLQEIAGALNVRPEELPYLGGGVSQKEGQRRIDKWNAGELRYLAIHPLSAGHGIELQFGGRRTFFYNPTWSGEEYAQLIKRTHRPGQTKPVYIHNIGVRGLIDELKLARCRGRVEEQNTFIQKLRSMK